MTGESFLRGDQMTQLGRVETAVCGPHCAIALTRGRHPKPYAHLDANEDFVFAAGTGEPTVLAVADGHNGIEAPDAAIGHVRSWLRARLPLCPLPEAALVDLLTEAGRAAWEATRAHPYPRRGSRTALGVVLASGQRVQWGVVGDVAVIAAGPGGARLLNTLDEVFLGGPAEAHHVAELSDRGEVELSAGDCLVLASDGLLNFASLASVAALLAAGAGDPEELARGLVELAGDGGAGDNVAVAIYRP